MQLIYLQYNYVDSVTCTTIMKACLHKYMHVKTY